MLASNPKFEIPQRILLSAQIADAMRNALNQGQWTKVLPSERQLCEQFHVSRPTVRSALHILAKEGRITAKKGERPRVASPQTTANPPQSGKVLLVTHEPPSRFSATAYHGISEMQTYLAKHGLSCELFVCKTRGLSTQLRKLEEHIHRNGIACCVLATVQKQVQQWFAAKSLPALVLGSCHPSVALPSFDVEHRSVCRHAAGILLSKGHRRLAMIAPSSLGPGDKASVEGFHEALESIPGNVAPKIVYHDGTSASLNKRVNTLFRSAHPPTALIVINPKCTLMVLVQLLRKGMLVPEKVSLIARDQDTIFNELTPNIAHYAFDVNTYTKRLARLILHLVDQRQLPLEPNLIFPQFVPGGTVRSYS